MKRGWTILAIVAGLVLCLAGSKGAIAQSGGNSARVDELRSRIEDRNSSIKDLEAEIKQYESQLGNLAEQAQTLKTAISTFDTTIKKFDTDIRLTQERINAAGLTIQQLSLKIADQESRITHSTDAIAGALRGIQEADTKSLAEVMLGEGDFSDVWGEVDSLQRFQVSLQGELSDLRTTKEVLTQTREDARAKAAELESLNSNLADQRNIAAYNRTQKNTLLSSTKNQEDNYKDILDEKVRQKQIFEDELVRLESELQIELDPSKIPEARGGVLAWPLDDVYVTQYFGDTAFSRAGGLGIYKGKGHNGMDFRAAIGTPVKAALSGEVVGTGNTDLAPRCYSFGQWVMIKHANGLSTLYAHLSLIKVAVGQQVVTGDVIAYSGNSGITTGPHLHFGVYATQGVRIQKFTNSKNCQNATIPIADLDAYLNPLSYLPELDGDIAAR